MIAGIDYSTFFVDIIIIGDDLFPRWFRYDLVGHDAFQRTRSIREQVPTRGWWRDSGVEALGIEDPRGHASGVLSRVQGGILQTLPPDLLVQPWDPKTWRVKNGLGGNCSKADVHAHVSNLWPEFADAPQDASDAYCIAMATSLALVSA